MFIGNISSQNTVLNANRVSQGFVRNANAAESAAGDKQANRDVAKITPQGKKQSLLSNLMKQKQNIVDQRSRLMGSNAEKGNSVSAIEEQLKLYEEQLKVIDEQIAQASIEEMKPEEEEKDSGIYEKPKTKEEVQGEKMNAVAEMASGIEAMEVINSVKSHLEGEANVLRAEIKSGNGPMEGKFDRLAEIGSRVSDLTEKAGEAVAELNEEVSELNGAEGAVKEDEIAEKQDPEAVTEERMMEEAAKQPEDESALQ